MGLLEILPHLDVPLHLQPEGEEAHPNADNVANASDGNPPVCDEEYVTKLPEAIEPVGEPAFGHDWAAVVVSPRPVVDTSDCCDTARTVLLPWVANALDELLVLGHV